MRGTLAQSRLASLARSARARFRDDDVGTQAAALAYQLFLSALALSLVGLAVIGLAERLLPFDLPAGSDEQFANLTNGSAALGIVSLLALLWTASALANRASRALAIVFRTGAEGVVRQRLRAVATTLGLIVLLGALPVLTGIVTAIRQAAGIEEPLRLLGWAATAALEFGLFWLAYAVLTPGTMDWRAHLPGAVVMTIAWELFKLAGGLLLTYFVSRSTLLYGTIGAVVGLLVFLRIAAAVFLFGAELSALIRDEGGG
jgi:YihY family inner membrane protein